MPSFRCTTEIGAAMEAVFDLARDIDAHTRSLADSNERAVAGVTAGRIELGESVTWRARHFGLPFTMTSAIVEMTPPHSFTDEQVRGPFKRFHHVHTFAPHSSGTLMVDEVTFDSPLGPLGRLVNRAVLTTYLRRLIEQRNAALKSEAERASR